MDREDYESNHISFSYDAEEYLLCPLKLHTI